MLRSVDITEKEKRLFKKFILLSHSSVSLTVFDKLKKKKNSLADQQNTTGENYFS